MKKRLLTILLGAAITAITRPATAPAATQTGTGSSKVTVVLPDIVVLDYFTNINLGLTAQSESHEHASYSKSGIEGGDQTIDGTGELTTGSLADANVAALRGSDITLTMKQVWAIRGFSASGKATVSIVGPSTLTRSATASTIKVSALKVNVFGNPSSSAGASITADLNGVLKTEATTGDVVMGLNFTNTTLSGDYTGTITITATTM
jgi:hypothetical protein